MVLVFSRVTLSTVYFVDSNHITDAVAVIETREVLPVMVGFSSYVPLKKRLNCSVRGLFDYFYGE